MEEKEQEVFTDKFCGGPLGLGDPNRRDLRNVEKEILIPQIMRTKAWKETCKPVVLDFNECAMRTGLLSVFKCRKENRLLQDCLTKCFTSKEFREECTEIYLERRAEYRRTGNQKKMEKMGGAMTH